ncbi:MAG: DUF4347 domain-containing protein, partial [bacterium]
MFDGAAAAEVASAATAASDTAAAREIGAVAGEPITPTTTVAPQGVPAPVAAPGRAVYVIDQAIRDADALLGALPAEAVVIRIASDRSGVAQLVEALSTQGVVGALHVLAHGAQGQFTLGSDTIAASTLEGFRAQWAEIGNTLAPQADVLLYGCSVAADGGVMVER